MKIASLSANIHKIQAKLNRNITMLYNKIYIKQSISCKFKKIRVSPKETKLNQLSHKKLRTCPPMRPQQSTQTPPLY